ncbi:MAG: hypothetical protein R3F14_09460 [Polyangiaceae bacterium]
MARSVGLLPLLSVAALALASVGCLPKIGDDCVSSLDCSQRGERLCDGTQPGGYCTIFGCEPDGCPDDASCVAFNHVLDPACGSTNDGEDPRFERTYCVLPCNEKSDCRDGYDCVEVAARGGLVLDKENPREKVCLTAVTTSTEDTTPAQLPGVCEPGEPGIFPDPYEPPAGTGGVSGAGGAGGTGGSGAGGS